MDIIVIQNGNVNKQPIPWSGSDFSGTKRLLKMF